MLYSSVWTRVPGVTAAVMIGLIVAYCALANMWGTTCPPRWIRPRIGGLSFFNVPRPPLPFQRFRRRNLGQLRPARLPACGTVQAAPFGDGRRLALVPGHHVDLVDPAGCPRIRLHLALQLHRRRFGDQAAAQLFRHALDIRCGQAQFAYDLPVGKGLPQDWGS